MSIGSVSNATSSIYTNYKDVAAAAKVSEALESKQSEAANSVVYDKGDTSSKATYSINKMSQADRSALIDQLKADQEARMQSL